LQAQVYVNDRCIKKKEIVKRELDQDRVVAPMSRRKRERGEKGGWGIYRERLLES